MESKRHVFARQYIVTSTICVQMWDHGGQKASLIIDEGEEEMTSRVWMGVYTFCTTMYYMLVAREPQFCIMTPCITTFWMLYKKFYGDRFIYLHV